MFTYSKKNLGYFVVVVILVIVLPLLLYLVKHTQIFRPKALGEGSSIEFTGSQGGFSAGNPPSTANRLVTLKLHYSSDSTGTTSPSPSSSTSTTNAGFSCDQVTACMADINNSGIVSNSSNPSDTSDGSFGTDGILARVCLTAFGPLSNWAINNYSGAPNASALGYYAPFCQKMDFNQNHKIEQSEVDCLVSKAGQTCSQNSTPAPSPTPTPVAGTCTGASISASPQTVSLGSDVSISGQGFTRFSTVSLIVTGPSPTDPGSTQVNGFGQIFATLSTSANEQLGVYQIAASGNCDGGGTANVTTQFTAVQ